MKIKVLIASIILFGCRNKQETIKPIVKTITESVYASGIVKSQNQYEVFTTVSGIIKEVLVEESELVKVGTPLFLIAHEQQKLLEDNAQLAYKYNALAYNKGKLQDAQSAINLAKQKMANEELMLSRLQTLLSQGGITKVEVEQKQLALESAKVSYKSALQNYKDLSKQLSYLAQQAENNLKISSKNASDFMIKSKINGKVFQINAFKGELAAPQAPLAIVGDEHTYILEMQVDEYDIISIQSGMKVYVVLNSYRDAVFTAKVTKINPIMNIQSKTFTVEAVFVEQPAMLYPSISFEANILVKSKQDALLIPRNYVKNDSIVQLSSGKERVIKTGIKDFEMIEIKSGINMNDELILPQQ